MLLVVIGVPISLLFAGSVILLFKVKTTFAVLQFAGAGGLMMVLLTHIAEALRLLSWMDWGSEYSPGHYLDLASAIVGLTLFPLGYLMQALARRPA
ncbi:MAG TPA: hypothetical protein VE687_11420 [Stellaceae bacterium]|jgi:hypothetical protein|nr:hypothetical protein [Stellaceae bacterium]